LAALDPLLPEEDGAAGAEEEDDGEEEDPSFEDDPSFDDDDEVEELSDAAALLRLSVR
jgi:hypothetical protein